ncbi:tyrosine-type recombinase/integrase [Mycobacterium sp. KBS0706]|uniref:tyrosine-type recombinase/integrase n=1 Tax=Mycobacterium sp. KBS0706 TaxID=2578109 RepID=UPI00117E88F7|nr:tyrosine-type recombinase/integrase [Mycobacterium sp. KBS0706]TSD86113.1 tyrosine-type recombinase/integrase [Mycobacterium sp. KBS0706]
MIDATIANGAAGEGAPAAGRPAVALPDAGAAAGLTETQRAEIRRLAQRADALVEASLSANTRKAYASAWQQWTTWCLGFDLDPAIADASWLAMHLTALSETRSLSTIELRRAAVLAIRRRLGRPLHLDEGYFPKFLQGLRRTKGVRPEKKAALLEENLRAVLVLLDPATAPAPKRCLRDRALLLTGFAGGFRRSELAGFDLRDVGFTAEGLVLFVAGSKNDQERRGEEVGVQAVPTSPLCAVTAVSAWLAVRGDAPGPLFCRADRGGHLTYGLDGRLQRIDTKTVARLVKRVIKGTGLAEGEFSAHSLRAGMMTAADRKGVPLEAAMQHGRWKDARTARGYRRHSSLWVGNFTGKLLADE